MVVGLFLAFFGLGFIWYNIIFTNRKLKDEKAAAHDLLMNDKMHDTQVDSTVAPEVMALENKDNDINK